MQDYKFMTYKEASKTLKKSVESIRVMASKYNWPKSKNNQNRITIGIPIERLDKDNDAYNLLISTNDSGDKDEILDLQNKILLLQNELADLKSENLVIKEKNSNLTDNNLELKKERDNWQKQSENLLVEHKELIDTLQKSLKPWWRKILG
ncbi:cell division protein ZapB [Bartonella sp. HY761]|uniref:cell division protein ZapB n=1 Tax=Bartonella sp. HY761 TaxID=2979330 RepID=UPI0021E2EC34|nr:cell division protein ZapB [Bartonella sp. HY761]UXN08144.1 cell division protein ZapB [Bartonella sp. HY761]